MASFRKRSGGWQARVTVKGQPAVVRTFALRADAEKWARAIERDMDMGAYVPRSDADSLTLGQLIKVYIDKVVPTFPGASTETIRLQTIQQALGHHVLSGLTPVQVAKYRDQRAKAVSPSTVLRELQTLSALLNFARKEMHIPIQNAVQAIRKPTPNRSRDRRLHPDEEMRLIKALTFEGRRPSGQMGPGTRNPYVRSLVEFALETAMRRGEMLSLRWEHVDLQKRTASLPITKNGFARTVPLSSKAIRTLDALPRSISGLVFPISASALKHAWTRACVQAQIADLHIHDLRHEAASCLAEKLPNVLEIAAVTGHRDLRMLQRYVHIKAEELAIKLA